MAGILGDEAGKFVRSLHEERGVRFHPGLTASAIDESQVTLKSGEKLSVDLVVAGMGVRQETQLAEKTGLALDRGASVDEHLETSMPGVFAAGDTACWPDPHTNERIRGEYWAVAERQHSS